MEILQRKEKGILKKEERRISFGKEVVAEMKRSNFFRFLNEERDEEKART